MNPLALLALRFLVGKGGTLLQQFAASVKTFKAMSPKEADIQALPDDAAAIEAFARATTTALDENQQIQARIRARVDRERG